MNILFLSENYYPNISGVPIVVQYLAEGLTKLGHSVAVATTQYKDCHPIEIINNVEVHRFDIHENHLHKHSGQIQKYVEFVMNYNADVVIFECLQCITTDLILPFVDQLNGRKILHSHGLSGYGMKSFVRRKDFIHTLAGFYHWIHFKRYYSTFIPKHLHKFDKILCLSKADNTIDLSQKLNLKCHILGNAVEDRFLLPTRENKLNSIYNLNKPYFLSVAYYNQIKNQIGILEAFYESRITSSALVFIGPEKNDYYDKLIRCNESLTQKYGSRDVLFLTGINRDDIPDIMGNAMAYIVGSTIEQFSISIIEAMSKKLPFISTNVGNALYLPGGIVVDSIADMPTAMLELANNPLKRLELGEKGREYVENNCQRDIVTKQLETLISE